MTDILWNPPFHYNPDLFWDADPGTPEPAAVGKTASHGCVRLTNWDAARLAALARPGTRVIFEP